MIDGRFTITQWRDLIINGLALGAVYALIALGYTLVYGILFMINFAHGEVFMAGAFTAYFAADGLADAGFLDSNPILALAIIFAVAMLTSMIIAVLLERIAYRKLRNAPRLVPLITAIGASLFLQYAFRGLYGSGVRSYPNVAILDGTFDIAGIPFRATQLMVIFSAIALMIGLWYLINRTRTGRAMRAVSEDRDTAALMGINVDATIVRTFAIGGALAGAAGVLYALIFSQVFFAHGLHPRHQGLHGGRARWHREHQWRRARRLQPRHPRAGRPEPVPDRLRHPGREPAARRHRLRGPRHRPHHPADRHPGEEGVMTRESLMAAVRIGAIAVAR